MSDDDQKELDATIAGQHIRAKGYRLLDLIWLPLILGVGYSALTLYQHEATAQTAGKEIAASVKEANMAVVNALKESNAATVQAIKDLALEQKKSTTAMRETACLLDPAIKGRQDGRELCKRMARDQ